VNVYILEPEHYVGYGFGTVVLVPIPGNNDYWEVFSALSNGEPTLLCDDLHGWKATKRGNELIHLYGAGDD
jgi:hypothetical protein